MGEAWTSAMARRLLHPPQWLQHARPKDRVLHLERAGARPFAAVCVGSLAAEGMGAWTAQGRRDPALKLEEICGPGSLQ